MGKNARETKRSIVKDPLIHSTGVVFQLPNQPNPIPNLFHSFLILFLAPVKKLSSDSSIRANDVGFARVVVVVNWADGRDSI